MFGTRTRQRDEKAAKVAEEVIEELRVAPDAKSVVRLGIFRGFISGRVQGREDREPEVRDLQRKLAQAAGNGLKYATAFTPAEIKYITTTAQYGLSPKDLAKLFRCEAVEIEEVIENAKSGTLRFGR